jgi:hypothetical protein
MTIKWEDPPENAWGPKTGKFDGDANELRANPGRWGYLGKHNSSLTKSIKAAKLVVFRPAGSFEAVSRNVRVEDGRSVADVYARYVGDGTSAEPERQDRIVRPGWDPAAA